jgi:outer membrane immunogenic protein
MQRRRLPLAVIFSVKCGVLDTSKTSGLAYTCTIGRLGRRRVGANMRRFQANRWMIAGALCALVCAAPALAADLPVKAPPMVVASVYNWTGIYGGVHVGYGQGMKDWLDQSFAYKVKGFLGGGQIGVNQQIGNWVIGLEADASWANIKGDQVVAVGPFGGATASLAASSRIDRLATLTGRLGFAQDRWLVYLKGGAAWAHETHDFRLNVTQVIPGAGPITQVAAASGSENRFGWVLGIGSEVALWGNWSFKSEYNYLHMGNNRVRLDGTQTILGVTTPFNFTENIHQNLHLAKFGLNYRFGPEGPPAIAPSRPAPGYNWTGAWLGAQAGYGFGHKHWQDFAPIERFDVRGWVAGATTGASVQAGAFVVGAESEWLFTGIRGGSQAALVLGPITQTVSAASKVDWLSLNSLRVGFVPADRWQVYGKGGIALAHETHDIGLTLTQPGGGATGTFSGKALHTGWLGGVGVEYAFLGNWSAKLEYNYLNFRLQNVLTQGMLTGNVAPFIGTGALPVATRIREEMHLVKLGINYRFNSLADVVTAKY